MESYSRKYDKLSPSPQLQMPSVTISRSKASYNEIVGKAFQEQNASRTIGGSGRVVPLPQMHMTDTSDDHQKNNCCGPDPSVPPRKADHVTKAYVPVLTSRKGLPQTGITSEPTISILEDHSGPREIKNECVETSDPEVGWALQVLDKFIGLAKQYHEASKTSSEFNSTVTDHSGASDELELHLDPPSIRRDSSSPATSDEQTLSTEGSKISREVETESSEIIEPLQEGTPVSQASSPPGCLNCVSPDLGAHSRIIQPALLSQSTRIREYLAQGRSASSSEAASDDKFFSRLLDTDDDIVPSVGSWEIDDDSDSVSAQLSSRRRRKGSWYQFSCSGRFLYSCSGRFLSCSGRMLSFRESEDHKLGSGFLSDDGSTVVYSSERSFRSSARRSNEVIKKFSGSCWPW